ncbi:MAG: CBS domain-containing protein [Gammaproteobacteria bacterium]|nr:CBS domain-containing protein [Gammaproteobacteria bacterium]
MVNKYKALPHYSAEHHTKVNQRTINRATDVSLDDPAILVMTDLHEITPFSIEPTAGINATNEKMIACGVRLLFVTGNDGKLMGIVTSTDVLGEKPVQYLKEHGGSHDDIIVQDIMTAVDALEVLLLSDVQKAYVGDVVQTMNQLGRQHTLVVDKTEVGESIVRGIFSTSQISHQLGMHIEPSIRAHTFADVEKVVLSA